MREHTSQNQNHNNEGHGQTRREHLLSLSAGAFAAMEAEGQTTESQENLSPEDLKKKRLKEDPNFIGMGHVKINYGREKIESASLIKTFLAGLIERQNKLFPELHTTHKARQTAVPEELVPNLAALDSGFKELAAFITQSFNIQGEYTSTDVDYFLCYELPGILAHYGILVKPITESIDIHAGDVSHKRYVFVELFQLEHKSSDKVKVWGQQLERDIFYARPYGEKDGVSQVLYESADNKPPAEQGNQNIILYSNYVNPNLVELKKNFPDILNAFRYIQSEKDFLSSIQSSTDPKYQAALLAVNKLLRKYGPEHFYEYGEDSHISHETGHLYFEKNKNNFPLAHPSKTGNAAEKNINEVNNQTHHEIDAMLTDLRLSKQKERFFMTNLRFLQNTDIREDFAHEEAARWVIERLVNLIKANPKKYGVNIDYKSAISFENQIILHLPEVIVQPSLIEDLAEKAMAIHKDNYQQDFTRDYYLKTKQPVPDGLPNTPLVEKIPQPKKEFPYPEIGIGVAVAVGAGIGLKRYNERKALVGLEESLPKALSRLEGIKKGEGARIVQDLQFGAGAELDLQKRQNALARLEVLAKENPKIAGQVGFLHRKLAIKEKPNAKGR